MTVLLITALILLILFLILYILYRYIFYSPNSRQNDDYGIKTAVPTEEMKEESIRLIDRINARKYEKVSITSRDGLRLNGRAYHAGDDRPLAILFHGYRGTPSRDFCGGANSCLDLGYNVLSVEERAHCTSEGHTITFGVKERYDCLAWAEYAASRFGENKKIVLVGISMGAAIVLMASELELPKNVRGIIADCPYTSPKAIIRKVAARYGYPVPILYPFIVLSALVFGHFSLTAADSSKAVRKAKVPILLIHGEADRLVPCDMSRQIAAANPEKIQLHTFPDAWHGISYMVDNTRYVRLFSQFCAECLET